MGKTLVTADAQLNERPLQTFRALLNLGVEYGRSQSDAWLLALAWLAMARLAVVGRLPGATGIASLLEPEAWSALPTELLPRTTAAHAWHLREAPDQEALLRSRAVALLAPLMDQMEEPEEWDVLDAPWHLQTDFGTASPVLAIAPQLCDLLLDLLSPPADASVWIPFDTTGQLVLRANRRGSNVIAVGPQKRRAPYLHFLAAIDSTRSASPSLSVTQLSSIAGLEADYVLLIPPFGMRLETGSDWRSWTQSTTTSTAWNSATSASGIADWIQFDRVESWAVSAFWPRTRKRGVFLVSPTLLFAKGQEERLREILLRNDGALDAVVTLPSRLFAGTSFSCAVLKLDRDRGHESVRLIEGADFGQDLGSSHNEARLHASTNILDLVNRRSDDSRVAADVSVEELEDRDFNLVPLRYIRRLGSVVGPQATLGDFVTVIRAPVSSNDPTALSVQEIGIGDLNVWKPLIGPFSKFTRVRANKVADHALRKDDIVLSIKGTVGKCGFVGELAATLPALPSPLNGSPSFLVVAQSCIALRISETARSMLLPEFLFMFLRSDAFREQVASLRVGAAISHVTPSALLKETQIPVLSLGGQVAYAKTDVEICALEHQATEAKRRIEDLRHTCWGSSEESTVDSNSPPLA